VDDDISVSYLHKSRIFITWHRGYRLLFSDLLFFDTLVPNIAEIQKIQNRQLDGPTALTKDIINH